MWFGARRPPRRKSGAGAHDGDRRPTHLQLSCAGRRDWWFNGEGRAPWFCAAAAAGSFANRAPTLMMVSGGRRTRSRFTAAALVGLWNGGGRDSLSCAAAAANSFATRAPPHMMVTGGRRTCGRYAAAAVGGAETGSRRVRCCRAAAAAHAVAIGRRRA